MIEARIRLWLNNNDYLSLDYALLAQHYAPSGERILDRRGLLHRIAPEGYRYPAALTLSLLPEELSRLNAASAGLRRSALEWLEAQFRAQSELVLYSEVLSLASPEAFWGAQAATSPGDNIALERRLAYRVVLDEVPPQLGSGAALLRLGAGSDGGLLDFGLHVGEDGSFSDFDSLSSYEAFSPAR